MGNFGLNKETFSAILGGLLPALAWLFFWMRSEEKNDREPISLVLLVFIIGMLTVLVAVPLQHLVVPYLPNEGSTIFVWAGIEELVKFLAVMLIIRSNYYVEDPMDFPMYLIAGALGFAALENILFLMNPSIVADPTTRALTGNLRFLGSTLLHAVSTGIVGIGVGLSYYQNWKNYLSYVIGGLALATTLHAAFNLFIMNARDQEFFRVFGFLWVITIISILLLEKLRRLKGQTTEQ